jgi:monofunctional biosynthetic peptidoglycan transglycosylase
MDSFDTSVTESYPLHEGHERPVTVTPIPTGPVEPPIRIAKPAKRHKGRFRRWLSRCLKLALVLFVVTELAALSFIWFTPSRTAFMLEGGDPVAYQYVSLDHVSRFMIASTLAHEDQQLGTRVGAFPMSDFTDRANAYLQGKPDPTGSTIPQQLVKNIFLWPSHDAVRKGIEAGLATEFSLTLSSQRIAELYLNYAQFGPHLYGVCAASWYYFNEAPSAMTTYQSAQLMGVLPLPDKVTRAKGGGIYLGPGVDPDVWQLVNGEANVWVPQELQGMGGWQAAVATIGIHDTAADHATTQDQPDGCSTMPASVADLLK